MEQLVAKGVNVRRGGFRKQPYTIDAFRIARVGYGAQVAHSARHAWLFLDAIRRNVKLLEGPYTSGWNA